MNYIRSFKFQSLILPFLILIITFLVRGFYSEQVEKENIQKFHFSAERSKDMIENRLRLYGEALGGLQGLYAASEQVNRVEFNYYVNALQLDERYPGFQALSFNRRITHEQKEAFERKVRADKSLDAVGYPNFVVKPQGNREEYTVVEFIEPKSTNEKAFGFDIASNPVRHQALEYTRDTGMTVATAPITLIQESGEQSGFLLLKPIYSGGLTPKTLIMRKQKYMGVVVAVFRVDNLLKEVLSKEDLENFTLKVHDSGSSIDNNAQQILTKIFDSEVLVPVNQQLLEQDIQLKLNVAGRIWLLSFHSIIRPVSSSSQLILTLITGGGIAFSLLLYGALYSASSRNRAMEKAKQLSTDLTNSQEDLKIAETVFANSSEGMIITDVHANILTVNKAFTKITGYSLQEAINQTPRILKSNVQNNEFYKRMWETLKNEGCWQGELWNRRKNGTLFAEWLTINAYRNSEGSTIRYICIFRDITEEKATQEHIQHLAFYDPLTDLANRTLLEDRMINAIHEAKRDGSNIAILFIDLDRFKIINDSLGHHIGDKLLQEVSNRIKGCVRESDTVARLGGDEFIVLLTGFKGFERTTAVMSRITKCLDETFSIERHPFHLSISTGISLYPKDGQEPDVLLKHADTAMYQAKGAGGNNYQFFDAQMNKEAIERMEIEHSLLDALKSQQLRLYFQPQVDIKTHKIIGFEALIRWLHPTKGLISPDNFIPIAEESDLILPISDWVLMEACHQGNLLQDMGGEGVKIAVNLSARQFGKNYDLIASVKSALEKSGFRPELLELEITETVLMEYQEKSLETLTVLRKMGISLSLDDFGTGYSSLSYLKYFPVDTIKIDRSFISTITEDQDSSIIVAAIIKLAHNLNLNIIAEGVETEEQLEYLQKHECEVFQGYLCSKPVPSIQLAKLLKPFNVVVIQSSKVQ
jgi:diguanylate cyclase (GGDEF)-like protein/PAS domain S-box-containing protein